jgi:hypothetical protein
MESPESSRGRPRPEAARQWEAWSAVSSWPSATADPIEGQGHFAGRYRLDVRVDPQSRQPYARWVAGASLAPGATLAVIHRSPDGAAGPVYAMQKSGTGTWEFLVATPGGALLPSSPLCHRCHAEAPSDFVFGLSHEQTAPDRDAGATGARPE